MSEETPSAQTQEPQAPQVEIPKPPSAQPRPPAPPASAAPQTPADAPPAPKAPVAPLPDEEARRAAAEALAEARKIRDEIAQRDKRASARAREDFARQFAGGLKAAEYAALLPDADVTTPEGQRALEDWLRAHPELVTRPVAAPAAEMTAEQLRLYRMTRGAGVKTAADMFGGIR